MVVGAVLDVAIGGLTKALDATTAALKDGFDLANKSQKASLALGMNLGEAREKLGGSMDALKGSIDQKLAGQFQTLQAGLQGNTMGVQKLINQQMLTGTNYGKTAKQFAALHSVAGLSMEATNNLAQQTVALGDQYGISTDELVNSMDGFASKFADMNLLGMGEGMAGAITTLKAKMGPEFGGSIDKIANMFVQTGTKGMNTMAALGLQGFRKEIQAAGNDQQAILAIFEKAITSGGKRFEQMVGGGADRMLTLGLVQEKFGDELSHINVLSEQIAEGFREQTESSSEYGEQIEAFIAEVWNPFKDLMLSIVMGALPFLQVGFEYLGGLAQQLVDRLSLWWIEMGGLQGVTENLKKKWEHFKNTTLPNINKAFKKVGEYIKTAFFVILTLVVIKYTILLGLFVLETIARLAQIPAIVAGAAALWAFVAPILPIILAITALIAVVVWLQAKFGIFDPVIDAVSWAFDKFKNGIGDMLIALGGIWGVPDILIEWGQKIKGTHPDQIKEAAKKKAEQEKEDAGVKTAQNSEDIKRQLEAQFAKDAEFAGVQKDALENIEINTRKAVDKTGPEFLDETAVLLSDTMSDILGISGRDPNTDLFEEMRDYMEVIADKPEAKPSPTRVNRSS